MVSTTRDGLHRLADALPPTLVDELAEVVRVFERQLVAGDTEEVTDPEEIEIVLQALHDDVDEPEYTMGEAKAYLEARRRARRGR